MPCAQCGGQCGVVYIGRSIRGVALGQPKPGVSDSLFRQNCENAGFDCPGATPCKIWRSRELQISAFGSKRSASAEDEQSGGSSRSLKTVTHAFKGQSDTRVVRCLVVADRSAVDVARRKALRSCGLTIEGLSRPSRLFSTVYEHLNGTCELATGLILALIEQQAPGLSSRKYDLPLHTARARACKRACAHARALASSRSECPPECACCRTSRTRPPRFTCTPSHISGCRHMCFTLHTAAACWSGQYPASMHGPADAHASELNAEPPDRCPHRRARRKPWRNPPDPRLARCSCAHATNTTGTCPGAAPRDP